MRDEKTTCIVYRRVTAYVKTQVMLFLIERERERHFIFRQVTFLWFLFLKKLKKKSAMTRLLKDVNPRCVLIEDTFLVFFRVWYLPSTTYFRQDGANTCAYIQQGTTDQRNKNEHESLFGIELIVKKKCLTSFGTLGISVLVWQKEREKRRKIIGTVSSLHHREQPW